MYSKANVESASDDDAFDVEKIIRLSGTFAREDIIVVYRLGCGIDYDIQSMKFELELARSKLASEAIDLAIVDASQFLQSSGERSPEAVRERADALVTMMEECVRTDVAGLRSYGFGVGAADDACTADSSFRALLASSERISDPKHFTTVATSANYERNLDNALVELRNDSPIWRVAFDALHPEPSTTAPDKVPFTFRGGERTTCERRTNDSRSRHSTSAQNMFDDPAKLLGALENALNGCIHLETFALDAMESRGADAKISSSDVSGSSGLSIPETISDPRSIAWGHVLGQNLARLGSTFEWSYVRENQMEAPLKEALDSIKSSKSQSTRDWGMLYRSRIAALDVAVSAYMSFRDRGFAADSLVHLRDHAVKCGIKSIEDCETLEEASIRLLLASTFDAVVCPSELLDSVSDSETLRQKNGGHRNGQTTPLERTDRGSEDSGEDNVRQFLEKIYEGVEADSNHETDAAKQVLRTFVLSERPRS